MVGKDEIIQELIEVGIIFQIGDKYIMSEKYKELLMLENQNKIIPRQVEKEEPQKLSREVLLNPKTNGSEWPLEVLEQTGRDRAAAFMTLCEVPNTSSDGTYRLRGLDAEAVNIIGNILETDTVSPNDMIAAVKHYYANTDRPKSFKNFVKEGDIADVYEEWISGGPQMDPNKASRRWS